jgi:hypothetical protein
VAKHEGRISTTSAALAELLTCGAILWRNNYAVLKIIDVGIFIFYFTKIYFSRSFSI